MTNVAACCLRRSTLPSQSFIILELIQLVVTLQAMKGCRITELFVTRRLRSYIPSSKRQESTPRSLRLSMKSANDDRIVSFMQGIIKARSPKPGRNSVRPKETEKEKGKRTNQTQSIFYAHANQRRLCNPVYESSQPAMGSVLKRGKRASKVADERPPKHQRSPKFKRKDGVLERAHVV